MITYMLKFKYDGTQFVSMTKVHPMYKRTISLKDLFGDFVYRNVENIEHAEEIITKAIAQSNYYFM